MKLAERIILVIIFLAFIGGAFWIYLAVQIAHNEKVEAVARGEYEIRDEVIETDPTDQSDWKRYYPKTIGMLIGSTTVRASVADTLPERIKGLSDTPYLPENVVKLFAFEASGYHSIWMKDMNYALDIIWATKEGEIVHIEENISPETYPESFAPSVPAWFVIEANAGFVAQHGIAVGDKVAVGN